MKLLEVVEETEVGQRLDAQIIASQALILLAEKLKLPEGIERSYDTNEQLSLAPFTRAEEIIYFLTRDLARKSAEFSEQFLAPAMERMAAKILSLMPSGATRFKCRALQLPQGVDMVYQACSPPDGLGLRIVRAYDVNTDTCPCYFHVYFRFE